MKRDELERLSRDELIELVLRLQRPEKAAWSGETAFRSMDRKEQRERSKPGGAKPGHEGRSRAMSDDVSETVAHYPETCSCCRVALSRDLPAEEAGVHESVELPEVRPLVVHHRRMAVRCPGCGARVAAPPLAGTPFGPRLHAVAPYLKTFQALSYERLQAALSDLFGLTISQGGLMNALRRAQKRFAARREEAVAALRPVALRRHHAVGSPAAMADVVASDETGVRIEGSNAYHWVFRCKAAVVHHADPTRAASSGETPFRP